MSEHDKTTGLHFIRQIIAEDNRTGKYGGRVVTRFPPEPNGYLHIGHAKAICLDFGMALENNGVCHLRFDDTNPETEETEYCEAIENDVRWLGFDWGPHLYYASDYFEQMHGYAVDLIRRGKAYVCFLTPDEFRECRGVPSLPGKESPYRNTSVEENLALFERMGKGEFDEGACVLRAKIDMASPNVHMRDPAIYRIKKVSHHRSGARWCIYPMYDFAHCLEDSIERVTHSICTLEFEVHRPLYDWLLETLGIYRPQQIEFARLNLSYTPEAIRAFCETIGVTKFNSLTDVALLEHCLREDLNKRAPRVMGVLNPVKLVIDNYPEGGEEWFEAVNNPEDPAAGTRKVPFSKVLYIEREDFMEAPSKKFFRLSPGAEVRLRYACLFRCTGVVKDAAGAITEIHGEYDPASRGGNAPDGRKVKGTIHWVSAKHGVRAEMRLYDRLCTVENPADAPEGKDFKEFLNPDSLRVTSGFVEPHAASAAAGSRFQFERVGYFAADPDSAPGLPVFNRTVTLRDSWAKIAAKEGA